MSRMKRKLFYFLLSVLLWFIKLISPKYDAERATFDGVGYRARILKRLCAGKRVFHIGFADAPLTEEKIRRGTLLHLRLKEVVEAIYGIDISEKGVATYRRLTDDYNNCVKRVENLTPEDVGDYDVILAGEILEHIAEPVAVLKKLRLLGKTVIITIPNARRLMGYLHAVQGKPFESSDHIIAFTYSTFMEMLRRAGFEIKEVYATAYKNYKPVIDFVKKYPMLCESFIFVAG